MKLCYDYDHVRIYQGDARNMAGLPSGSVHLIVTSLPYFNGREYSQWASYPDYIGDMTHALKEAYRVLCDGGRICVNVPHVYGRQGKDTECYPIEADITKALTTVRFKLRGVIIWVKPSSVVSSSTAWGSWQSASNPSLRDQHEVIIICHKGSAKRERGESTISAEDFTNWTRSVWDIPPAPKSWHPAPFPAEIPRRLIQLYSYKRDIVLDPFAGSYTTPFAAATLGREGIGVELNENYIKQACGPLLVIEGE